jgi:ATP-binding cassette, subfamily B, multidrug efflux pump
MLIRLLRSYTRPYTRMIATIAVLQLLQTAAALSLPALNADVIDNGVVKGDTHYIVHLGGVMIALTALQVMCATGAVYLAARTATAVGADIRAALFRRVQSFSAREIGDFGTSSLVTRTTNDVQQVQMLVLTSLTLMVTAPITCFGGIALALGEDVPLSLVIVGMVSALGTAIGLLIRSMQAAFRTMQERADTVTRILREQIAGVRVIRAFVRDDHERDRFGCANERLTEAWIRVGRMSALIFPMMSIVVNIAAVPVVWFGAYRLEDGAIQIGTLTAFLSYLTQILVAVTMAGLVFMMVPRAEVCAERIREVLTTRPSVLPPASPVRLARGHGTLEVRGVRFRYPGAEVPVLRGVDLVARPGETTAVIGPTASGKTTLLWLIPRLFDATDGEILVDGVNVADLEPPLLTEIVGLVPQKPHLFAGTVASNVRYGRPGATEAEVWHALDVAQAKEFVERMEGGLDAPITAAGRNVSGGQRQRLAIARVLVRRPRIYLFDDCFAALDYSTGAALRRALAAEISDAAVVIAAQQVSAVQDADRIVVLDAGRVAGSGAHENLLAVSPVYREIAAAQSAMEAG